jgi:hypothetical protein
MCSLYRNEYRNFKLAGATMGSGLGRSEEDWKRRTSCGCDIYMHGNNTRTLPVCYLYLKLAKSPCFSFYILCFFFYKIREQEGGKVSAQGRGAVVGTSGRGGDGGERGRRMNTIQIMYTHVCKCKNDTCCNCFRNQGRGDERVQWRG